MQERIEPDGMLEPVPGRVYARIDSNGPAYFKMMSFGEPRWRCPCCFCWTLPVLGGYEICPICFWEDDGQVDSNADEVIGGANGPLSLTQARENYRATGSSWDAMAEFVRLPTDEEREPQTIPPNVETWPPLRR